MTKPNVYFRADGNTQIGLGHIIRSLALADMLAEEFQCFFLVQVPSETLQAQITEKHQLIVLESTTDYLEEATRITKQYLDETTIIVLDGYNFRTEYQQIIKASRSQLVCIDDLHEWHFVADVVINQAGGVKPSSYSCEPYTKLCLGTEFALLRKPFRDASQEPRNIKNLTTVFICFGGSDIKNLTEQAVLACLSLPSIRHLHVVTGSAYPYLASLEDIQAEDKTIQLHQNLSAKEMTHLMSQCSLAITSASGIAYEVCSVGLGLVVGTYVNNQLGIYNFLTSNQLAFPAGNYLEFSAKKFTKMITELSIQIINAQITRQRKYFAHSRILKTFQKIATIQNIEISKASAQDIHLYFEWANDPATRKNAINTDPIPFENHQKWFQAKLQSPDTILYKFSQNGDNIGQVRFDLVDEHLEIDYSIAPQLRGHGLGETILQLALKTLIEEKKSQPKIQKIIALVKPENISSKTIFERLNFEFVGNQTIKQLTLKQYQKLIHRVY
ncbi:UDP-2,4-diacetamido-2,4,6-trideoxy-beta-L-altropyranose hydrolase [marine bacterium AO1-C]|nr:UDP-2,4-diacetamido-2,4,6-trideoxy-beta-L-altropyranose hydrolase [marine bacterium AO1-C]